MFQFFEKMLGHIDVVIRKGGYLNESEAVKLAQEMSGFVKAHEELCFQIMEYFSGKTIIYSFF